MFRRDLIQYVGTLFTRSFAKVFWIFPIANNKVIFTSFIGKQRSCNPLYIQKYLQEKYQNEFKLIWVLREKDAGEKDSNTVRFLSLKHFYNFCTAKVIVDNGGMPTYMPKRRRQYVINTWHGGGAYKRSVGLDISKKYRVKLEEYKGRNTDLVLSSCETFSTKAIPDIVIGYSGEIMPCGCPRNDIFWSKNTDELKKKIHSRFNIQDDALIVLFAPTFRGISNPHEKFHQQIKWSNILQAVEKRFGRKAVAMFRAHNYMSQYDIGSVIDATSYPDMQELLCAADILISDYSSTIWDFSLMKRPCFLYCPDLDYYLNEDRGVYVPIETWPGILCRTNEELEQAILNFDAETYAEKVEKYHQDMGSYETGHACEQVCKRIAKVCGVK